MLGWGMNALPCCAESLNVAASQVKAHYKKSAAVHTFARLMDLLTDPSSSNSTMTIGIGGQSVGGVDHDLTSKGKHPKVGRCW